MLLCAVTSSVAIVYSEVCNYISVVPCADIDRSDLTWLVFLASQREVYQFRYLFADSTELIH
jgi:hypothetical protein